MMTIDEGFRDSGSASMREKLHNPYVNWMSEPECQWICRWRTNLPGLKTMVTLGETGPIGTKQTKYTFGQKMLLVMTG